MSDRNLVTYQEERNEFGPYWQLKIDRSAADEPGLLFTISMEMYDSKYSHLNQEMTIVVDDGDTVLKPVLDWLKINEKTSVGPDRIAAAITADEEHHADDSRMGLKMNKTGFILLGQNPNGSGLIEYEISATYPLIMGDGPYKVRIDAYYPRPDEIDFDDR